MMPPRDSSAENAGVFYQENGLLHLRGNPEAVFREDPLQILRFLRLSLDSGLPIAPEAEAALLSQTHLLEQVPPNLLYEELCKLLPLMDAAALLHFAPVFAAAIPELKPMIGFDQHSPHHAYDLFTHTACVTAAVPPRLTLRWAALLHDIGKVPTFTRDETGRGHFYGHAGKGAEMADAVLRRMDAPASVQNQAVFLIANHMTRLEPDRQVLRCWLDRLGPETVEDLLCLQEADMGSKGISDPEGMQQFPRIRALLAALTAENR